MGYLVIYYKFTNTEKKNILIYGYLEDFCFPNKAVTTYKSKNT